MYYTVRAQADSNKGHMYHGSYSCENFFAEAHKWQGVHKSKSTCKIIKVFMTWT